MDLKIENKLALVTGSTAGIGLAIAKSLAAAGCRVIVNGRTEARVAGAIAQIRQAHPQSQLEPLAADLAQAEGAAETCRRFPAVDILVNNLGMYAHVPFEAISDADWQAIIEINFMSGMRLSRCYLPAMLAAGWGRIIFLSSESGINIPVEMIHYGVTKAMYLALSRGLAETTRGTGVTVNAVLPGPTRSEGVGRFLAELAQAQGITPAEVEQEFFRSVRPTSIPAALRQHRRGRQPGGLCGQPPVLGHQRRGFTGRRRGGQIHHLNSALQAGVRLQDQFQIRARSRQAPGLLLITGSL